MNGYDDKLRSDVSQKILRLINLFGKISFEEFALEIRNIQVLGFWCCLHELRNVGYVDRGINKRGEIEFFLTEKGKEFFESMSINEIKELV